MTEEKIFIDSDDSQYAAGGHQETIRVLVFSLAQEYYCIDVASAKRVAPVGLVTRLPNVPSFIKGVTNLAGQIIPLVDISIFLGIASLDMLNELKIIVMEMGNSLVGILVDSIEGVTEIQKEALQMPLSTLKGKLLELTIGEVEFKNRILVMLDLKKILNSSEFNKFAE